MTVVLKSLGEAEREAVIALDVGDDQDDFVATNAESLEEADENPACVPLGVFSGDEPVVIDDLVGFAMYALDGDDGNWWIYRLMIDKRFQKRGFGRAALSNACRPFQAATPSISAFIPRTRRPPTCTVRKGFARPARYWATRSSCGWSSQGQTRTL